MGANDAEERGQLIPQLPEALVLAQVIPRLPWYTRPLCRTLSKAWRAMMDTRNPELDLQTRMFQLPLLRGLFLFCAFDKQIFIRDHHIDHGPFLSSAYQIQPRWRKLPPLRGLVVPSPTRAIMLASKGMVYVWSDNVKGGPNFVLKLDMGRADWRWNVHPVPYAFNSSTISFHGKLYVPGIAKRISTDPPRRKKVVLEYDMLTDRCKHVQTWNQDDLCVLPKCAHYNSPAEELYSFVKQEFDTKLEVLMYDVESESWMTQVEVPIPMADRCPHLPQVKLLNSDSFEPAPKMGINIIWIDRWCDLIYWFNSSVGNKWVKMAHSFVLEGKFLENLLFICGSMYAIFRDKQEKEDDVEEDDDGGGFSGLFRRAIMKGTIIVASSSVAWEEVHEVGFFEEAYPVDSMKVLPIDSYTSMV